MHDTLDDLEAKAKAATLPKIIACPKCDSTSPPDWTERSPSGNSQCSSCKKPSANWAWVKQAPFPFHPDPDTVLALITALREAERIITDARDVARGGGPMFPKLGQRGDDWLAKYAKGEEG